MAFQGDDETICSATKSINKAIGRILDHRSVDERSQRQIKKLVEHIQHLLKELYIKRQSLRALIGWFEKEWERIEPRLAENPLKILQHSMENFVRMSDGLVLLTSGECRHPFDIRHGQKTKFPSKLSTLKERQDGYTCLYKTDAIYSGFGWDEFCNESVGIRARLIGILSQYIKSPWEYLERKGATELLESCLDHQEFAVKELQQQVQGLKKKMIHDIKLRLKPQQLSFLTQDKMERLVVATEKQSICLERRADNFQIKSGSVLPNDCLRESDWNVLSLMLEAKAKTEVSTRHRKRRLVIDESDSDDEVSSEAKSKKKAATSEVMGTKQQAAGLMVRIQSSATTAETENSLLAIKTQMGVDVQGLEASRENLEHENGQNLGATDCKKEKTRKLRRVFDRVLSRQDVDDNEVWDARECLRQSHMELGNELLWSTQNCEKALDSFQQAKTLVQQQQDSHHRIVQTTNDDTFESRYIQRNLIFLLGQATVNSGIALVQWAQQERKIVKRKADLAIAEFQSVKRLASEMRHQAETEKLQSRVHSSDWKESAEDSFRADQLESMSCRWMGICLWLSSKEKEAVSSLEHASSFFRSNGNLRNELIPFMLEIASECVYATSVLADFVCSTMERLPWKMRDKGDEYLEIVERALKRYVEIVGRLEQISSDQSVNGMVQSFQLENGISSSKQVLENLEEIKNWWSTKKTQSMKLSLQSSAAPRLSSILPRLDLFPGGKNDQFSEVTSHIILTEGGRKQKQAIRNGGSNSSNSRNAVHALQQNKEIESKQRSLRFRKWGDGLLLMVDNESEDKRSGASAVVKLAYPSIVPVMPDDIRTLAET